MIAFNSIMHICFNINSFNITDSLAYLSLTKIHE